MGVIIPPFCYYPVVKLDIYLIMEAEALATGQFVHKVANMVDGYKGTYQLIVDEPLPENIELFQESERNLRSFVFDRKQERSKFLKMM